MDVYLLRYCLCVFSVLTSSALPAIVLNCFLEKVEYIKHGVYDFNLSPFTQETSDNDTNYQVSIVQRNAFLLIVLTEL